MKKQRVPKFLKEEISKYICVLIEHKHMLAWACATPYMEKIIAMYDNIPARNIIQSYTARDERLNGYMPTYRETFARNWIMHNLDQFYNDDNVKIYMDKYCPEGLK